MNVTRREFVRGVTLARGSRAARGGSSRGSAE
jgi:hypothetical protein